MKRPIPLTLSGTSVWQSLQRSRDEGVTFKLDGRHPSSTHPASRSVCRRETSIWEHLSKSPCIDQGLIGNTMLLQRDAQSSESFYPDPLSASCQQRRFSKIDKKRNPKSIVKETLYPASRYPRPDTALISQILGILPMRS